LTLTPIISPKVKTELTSGLPNSVFAAASWSMCSGCGLWVSVEISRLSVSVTVREIGMLDAVADLPLVEKAPWHGRCSRQRLQPLPSYSAPFLVSLAFRSPIRFARLQNPGRSSGSPLRCGRASARRLSSDLRTTA
jgi:hypothetical protein